MVEMLCFNDHGIYDSFMKSVLLKLESGTARPAPFDLPPTDVMALLRELTTRGPEAALPQNLTDAWLRALVRDIVVISGSHDQTAVKMLVFALVSAQNPDFDSGDASGQKGLFESEPWSSYLQGYQLALISELVDRQVGAHANDYKVEDFLDQVTAKRRHTSKV